MPELNFSGSYQISGKSFGHYVEGQGSFHVQYGKLRGVCLVLWLFHLFCNVWLCACLGVCNVWVCACLGVCNVWVCACFGVCNVWVCSCLGVYVWVCECVCL